MKKSRETLKILYLQIRNDQQTALEEFDEFVRYGGLSKDQFTIVNVFDTPEFGAERLQGHDAVFVGGSSDGKSFDAEGSPYVLSIGAVLLGAIEQEIPVFASCFGFEVAVNHLGGQMHIDESKMEMGVLPLTPLEAAHDDVLFGDMPESFYAVCGHKEQVQKEPEGVVWLVRSEMVPYHAFTIPGKPFYAFQFHPEINPHDLDVRITRYAKRYNPDPAWLESVLETTRNVDTDLSNGLVRKFVDRIILASA